MRNELEIKTLLNHYQEKQKEIENAISAGMEPTYLNDFTEKIKVLEWVLER